MNIECIFRRLPAAVMATLLASAVWPAYSQSDYPNRQVTIVVGSQPGGAVDVIARLMAPKLNENLGKPFIVDNRPGAGSTIGAQIVADANPDGYTMLFGTVASNASSPHSIRVKYDPVDSFKPVSFVASLPLIFVVRPEMKISTVDGFIKLVKSKPGQLNYSSPGKGTPQHLTTEIFSNLTGIKMVHIPYKSGSAAIQAVLTGEADMFISGLTPALPQINAGKLTALAVTTSTRSPFAPAVPTMAEVGFPEFEIDNWNVAYVPAKTPDAIVAKLREATKEMLAQPQTKTLMGKVGAEPKYLEPQVLDKFLRNEVARWGKAAKEANITAQ